MRTRDTCIYSANCKKFKNCTKNKYCKIREEMKENVMFDFDFLCGVAEKIAPFSRETFFMHSNNEYYIILRTFVIICLSEMHEKPEIKRATNFNRGHIERYVKNHAQRMLTDKYYRNYYKLFLKTKSQQVEVSKYPIDFAS